jgi:hypothetical protein
MVRPMIADIDVLERDNGSGRNDAGFRARRHERRIRVECFDLSTELFARPAVASRVVQFSAEPLAAAEVLVEIAYTRDARRVRVPGARAVVNAQQATDRRARRNGVDMESAFDRRRLGQYAKHEALRPGYRLQAVDEAEDVELKGVSNFWRNCHWKMELEPVVDRATVGVVHYSAAYAEGTRLDGSYECAHPRRKRFRRIHDRLEVRSGYQCKIVSVARLDDDDVIALNAGTVFRLHFPHQPFLSNVALDAESGVATS